LSDPATGQLARQTYRTGEFPAISRSTKRQTISQATRKTWLCDLEP
jgi:hypothetical protein